MRATTLMTSAAAGLLAIGALAGCSASTASAPASEANLTGTPVTASEEAGGLCEAIVSQNLPLDAADALAVGSGYTTRVLVLEGEPQAVTQDLREDRLNFEVESGLVVACTLG